MSVCFSSTFLFLIDRDGEEVTAKANCYYSQMYDKEDEMIFRIIYHHFALNHGEQVHHNLISNIFLPALLLREMKRPTGGNEGERKTKWQRLDVEIRRRREQIIYKR